MQPADPTSAPAGARLVWHAPVRHSVGVLGRLKTVSGRLSELVERELPELVAAPAGGGKVGTLPARVAAAGGSNGAGYLEQRGGAEERQPATVGILRAIWQACNLPTSKEGECLTCPAGTPPVAKRAVSALPGRSQAPRRLLVTRGRGALGPFLLSTRRLGAALL